MSSIEDFVELVNMEAGLSLKVIDADVHFDHLEGWDSLHLLAVLTALERQTGRRISMPDVLTAQNLRDVYKLVIQS
ncbi:Phosphopantetheine attachment site [Nocardia amikacinitolerans]|uniref:acyl carrier protein n=1 Tax=Nocardia amikacinitolerans TaxID=756689 RepID=UPI00083776E7|nr:acyl carrier protein [Nocardia amikacinitolerans]MCP2321422.1 Phosphopantetheine attachment site [Nocardia amikacinitolerans]